MNVVGIVLIVALGALVVWLGIDTAIYIVKKTKLKKQQKQDEVKENQDTSNQVFDK